MRVLKFKVFLLSELSIAVAVCWKGVDDIMSHRDYCGEEGKFMKKWLRGIHLKLSEAEEREMEMWMAAKCEESLGRILEGRILSRDKFSEFI